MGKRDSEKRQDVEDAGSHDEPAAFRRDAFSSADPRRHADPANPTDGPTDAHEGGTGEGRHAWASTLWGELAAGGERRDTAIAQVGAILGGAAPVDEPDLKWPAVAFAPVARQAANAQQAARPDLVRSSWSAGETTQAMAALWSIAFHARTRMRSGQAVIPHQTLNAALRNLTEHVDRLGPLDAAALIGQAAVTHTLLPDSPLLAALKNALEERVGVSIAYEVVEDEDDDGID